MIITGTFVPCLENMPKVTSSCQLTFYYKSNSVANQHLNCSISNINNNDKIPLGIS